MINWKSRVTFERHREVLLGPQKERKNYDSTFEVITCCLLRFLRA